MIDPCRLQRCQVAGVVAGATLGYARIPGHDLAEGLREPLVGLGARGILLYIGIYVVATLLLLPGMPLTVAAGLIFGLWSGVAIIVVASTISIALSFLLARHLARRPVERLLHRRASFRAVDQALGRRGWRIVALVRISSVFPFGVQNYAYGLSSIGFWPCLLTSVAAMFPGTVVYVYLGHVARLGVEATTAGSAAHTGVWVLRGVGLCAALATIFYVTHISRKALSRETASTSGADS